MDGYNLAFSFFSKVLTAAPETSLLMEITKNKLMQNWPIVPKHENAKTGLMILRSYFDNPDPQMNGAVQQDYFLLFEQSPPLCRPWESVWRDKYKLLFDEKTFQVREWYTRFGLRAPNFNREPDDHLGLELGFLAYLLNLAKEEEDQIKFHEIKEGIGTFLQNHPLPWGPDCLLEISKKAQTDFYKGVGLLAAGTLVEFNALINTE